MSGQPYRYASDPARFRDEFMKTLALQADINALNLDANKTYASTGQLPAISQMEDTRTTSEILADTEKLKVEILADLKPLGSSVFGSAIIQAIQRSPLNVNGTLFTFFAQRAPEIVKNVQLQYKYGIKGDSNDVQRFISFVEDMYNKTKSLTSSVKNYFAKPQESDMGITITLGELDKINEIYNEITRRLLLKFGAPRATNLTPVEEEMQTRIYFIALALQGCESFLKDSEYVANTKAFIDSQIGYLDRPEFEEIVDDFFKLYNRYNEILEEFPKAETLFSLLRQLDNATKNANPELALNILSKIEEMLTFENDLATVARDLKNAREKFEKMVNEEETQFEKNKPPEFPGSAQKLGGPKVNPTRKIGGMEIPFLTKEEKEESVARARVPVPTEKSSLTKKEADNLYPRSKVPVPTEKSSLTKKEADILYHRSNVPVPTEKPTHPHTAELKRIKNELELINDEAESFDGLTYEDIVNVDKLLKKLASIDHNLDFTFRVSDAPISEIEDSIRQALNSLGMKGIGMKKTRGRPKGCGISKPKTYKESVKANTSLEKGIHESPRFVKFGKYLVNMHKLNNEDIFALKRPSGGNIVELPSTRLSKNMTGVIKKMVGGSVPSYAELSKLSDQEKAYLQKVASKSNILDKFSIPTPSKDQQEKDIHQFEVMKGEIIAGNDSKELIKKFKLHLVKLSKNGTLPKREVQEVMEELLELGY